MAIQCSSKGDMAVLVFVHDLTSHLSSLGVSDVLIHSLAPHTEGKANKAIK
jgi:hypothetical protein